ncbi:unnamed protein product [Ilex paraguariensis]|uniref:Uncharacterized protein n=1 Tax=Ilex paraguariensis TaxID=185542 RepID=A0ABC8SFI7_9AQUA
MAVALRGGRGGSGGGSALRKFFSYRIFVSAMFTLLFLATLSVLFSSHPYDSDSICLQISRYGGCTTGRPWRIWWRIGTSEVLLLPDFCLCHVHPPLPRHSFRSLLLSPLRQRFRESVSLYTRIYA